MNIDTGEIRPWAELTEEERSSGKWIALSHTDENGQPIYAKRKNPFHDMFPPRSTEDMVRDMNARFDRMRAVVAAINEGENRYRQQVLGQGPLPGFPKEPRDG